MKFSADKVLEMTEGKGGATLAGKATEILKRRIWFLPKTRLFTDCPSDLVSEKSPSNCPNCNGEREWNGTYQNNVPEAICHFCGMTMPDEP
jgi:hypothetical protein